MASKKPAQSGAAGTAVAWLQNFADALAVGDGAGALFHDESYWCDLVTFSWNIKTAEGECRGGCHGCGDRARRGRERRHHRSVVQIRDQGQARARLAALARWQMLGLGLQHAQRPRAVGGRVAQHVEADAARCSVVPRRQPPPIAPLFAIPLPATQSAMRGHSDASVWAGGVASSRLIVAR